MVEVVKNDDGYDEYSIMVWRQESGKVCLHVKKRGLGCGCFAGGPQDEESVYIVMDSSEVNALIEKLREYI